MAQNNSDKVPKFDGNYSFWKEHMAYYLDSMLFGICDVVKNGYTPPTGGPSTTDEIRLHEYNGKARNTHISGLSDSKLLKVMSYMFAREVWNKLSNIYEGDKKIKQVKMQDLKYKFEASRMFEDENINSYLHQVNEVVSAKVLAKLWKKMRL